MPPDRSQGLKGAAEPPQGTGSGLCRPPREPGVDRSQKEWSRSTQVADGRELKGTTRRSGAFLGGGALFGLRESADADRSDFHVAGL